MHFSLYLLCCYFLFYFSEYKNIPEGFTVHSWSIRGHASYCSQLVVRYSRVNYVWETSRYTTAASTSGRLVFVKKTGHINLARRTALSWTTERSPPRPFLGPHRPTARDSPPPTGFRTKARPPDALFLFRPPCLCSFCILTWKETFPKCFFLLCTTQT